MGESLCEDMIFTYRAARMHFSDLPPAFNLFITESYPRQCDSKAHGCNLTDILNLTLVEEGRYKEREVDFICIYLLDC